MKRSLLILAVMISLIFQSAYAQSIDSQKSIVSGHEDYLLSVSSAYYDVLKAKKSVEIAKANVERLTKHRDAAAIRLKVGEVTKTVLLRAEAELSGAQSDEIKAKNGLELSKAALARIVGIERDYRGCLFKKERRSCIFIS